LPGATLRSNGTSRVADDKCGHDRAKGVGIGEGRGLAIGEQPELFQSGNVAAVETARKIRIALCEGSDQTVHRDVRRRQMRGDVEKNWIWSGC
jgi:hypothetical protein